MLQQKAQNTMGRGVVVGVAFLLLMVGVVALAAPPAAAHTCSSYSDKCDPNGCTEGEYHDHTRMHYWPKRDEHCSSKPEAEPGCTYNGVDLPARVCKLLSEETEDPGAVALH